MIVERIQGALRAASLDGWLFFDHHRRDPLAYRILQVPQSIMATRRWYYFIPAVGEPRKLVHRIENASLDSLPGEKDMYSSWADQQRKVNAILSGSRRVAMQYSPHCAIPYVSLVDGGTLELVREAGVEVVSSADLVQEFEARWTEEQLQMHIEAGRLVDQVRRESFDLIGQRVRCGATVTEFEVQQFMCRRFAQLGLVNDHGPIVAANANASDPHYEPSESHHSHIHPGDVVLIDCWAKLAEPDAVYYDITWTGFCGDSIPPRVEEVFDVVRDARKKASDFVIQQVAAAKSTCGFEVDDAARGYIDDKGFGDYFFHRTGHSIGADVHGTGANMDNLESHDERRLIPATCFSIEPGIYLAEFGIRSEVNVYIAAEKAFVTGEEQEKMVLI